MEIMEEETKTNEEQKIQNNESDLMINTTQSNVISNIIQQKIVKRNAETIIKKYIKGKVLRKGKKAKCYELTDTTKNKLLSVKIIPKSTLTVNKGQFKLFSQIKIHKQLDHPNIVKFQHSFHDEKNVYIIFEGNLKLTLTDLINTKKTLTQDQVRNYLLQIINSLKYLHQLKIIYRGLKPSSLFFTQKMEVKLCDFDSATQLNDPDQKKIKKCGTLNYVAPEILNGQDYGYEVDIWSLGVIMYNQLFGKLPFEAAQVESTQQKIKACEYQFPNQIIVSQNAKDLMVKILNVDRAKRPTLDQILLHPFMNPNRISKLQSNLLLVSLKPQVYVKKIMNFQKFALGYLLSDGSIGAYYKDHTKLILSNKGKLLYHIGKTEGDMIESVTTYTLHNYPKQSSFTKYMDILNCFLNTFYEQRMQQQHKQEGIFLDSLIYVQKWGQTKESFWFVLTNKIFQVNFKDKSQLILSGKQSTITYRNPQGKRQKLNLQKSFQKHYKMIKPKLQHTERILEKNNIV